MRQKNSSWYYNRSNRDIIVAELDITLRARKSVDLYQIKPTLRSEFVRYSERFGVLGKKIKSGSLVKLPGPPPKPTSMPPPLYIESTKMLETRSRSCVEVDPAEKDFIENLEAEFLTDGALLSDHERSLVNDRFIEEMNLDGFSDPLNDDDE